MPGVRGRLSDACSSASCACFIDRIPPALFVRDEARGPIDPRDMAATSGEAKISPLQCGFVRTLGEQLGGETRRLGDSLHFNRDGIDRLLQLVETLLVESTARLSERSVLEA